MFRFTPPLAIKASTVAVSMVLGILSGEAQAISLLTNLGGSSGFGELAMSPNDDGSSGLLNLPFTLDFFGQQFNNFFVNNNGNITFRNRLSSFTPNPFPVSGQPMIAPYWADVDTRNGFGNSWNNVYVAAPNESTVVVTWHNVGYYSNRNDKLNNFQLVLQKTANNGSFSAEFLYDRLEWTTGGASGGSNGFGGVPAQAGYDAGDNVNFFTLPGSRTSNVLNLVNSSNVSSATPGLWRFLFNNGALPGQTPENALLPVEVDGSFEFSFTPTPATPVFIDPWIATGYDYEITSGANSFTSVLLPTISGDTDGFEIYTMDGTFLGTALSGVTFNFSSALTAFKVLDIDTEAMLDPTNTTAFVTGLTFLNSNAITMTQTPITTFVSSVPEPEYTTMLVTGLFFVGGMARRRQTKTA